MNESTAAKRGDLRRQVLELRSAQRPLEVARKSQLICATLKQIPELQRARTIMALVPPSGRRLTSVSSG